MDGLELEPTATKSSQDSFTNIVFRNDSVRIIIALSVCRFILAAFTFFRVADRCAPRGT